MTATDSSAQVSLRSAERKGFWRTRAWLGLSLLAFSIVLALTLLFSLHSRSLLADLRNTRISQARNRAARRIELDTRIICGVAAQLRDQIDSGILRTPAQFNDSAESMRREQTPIRSIQWIDADGRPISAVNADPATGSTANAGQTALAAFIAQIQSSPDGQFISVEAKDVPSLRTIAVPIHDHSFPTRHVIGAVTLSFSLDELIEVALPTDPRTPPRSTRVEDQNGRVLMVSGDQTPFLTAKSKAADSIHVLDQWWTLQIAPAASSTWLRPAEDSYAFLIAGILLAILAGGTVGHVVRSRQRVQETIRAHLDALEALHKVAAMLGVHARPSDEVLDQMMKAACDLLKIRKAFVCRLEDGQTIRLMYHMGFQDTPPDWVTRPLATTPAMARCMRTREPLYVPDIKADPDPIVDVLKMDRYHIRSVLMFPLVAGPEVIGVMVMADDVPRKFSESERRLAHLWASQCAVTLVNQRLANESATAIREQRVLNEQVERDAQTKELLLREMNHRVKNNMAGIIGLLSAEAPDLSVEAQQWLDRAISRISTLARAHELFVGLLEEVNLLTLIAKIIPPVEALLPPGARLIVEGEVAAPLGTDQAVTLAMVVNELANNAIDYGIGPRGVLRIRASRCGGNCIRVEIIDDGSRRPIPGEGETVERRHSGLGLKLVQGLVSRELHGTFDLSIDPVLGTTATIEFPVASSVAKIKAPLELETSVI